LEYNIQQGEKSLTADQIMSICQRGFGADIHIKSIQELEGGTFNTAYLVSFAGQRKVILRVSPPATAQVLWDEVFLMRREHAIQPFFAPVAALMPRTLLVDFTHQLIDRDYIFQTFIEGERWDHVMDDLTSAENDLLWDQFGNLLKQIHNVHGETFGLPLSGFQFPSWSQTVIDRLERTLQAAQEDQLEVPHLNSILETVRAHPQPLDEIQVPRLLHGDLWLFNILIGCRENDPAIVGILDADRAWWGDPMADWTMFILAHAEEQAGHSRFWQAYGQPEETPAAGFRANVYDAMHAGTAFIWAVQHQDEETVTRAKGTLSHAAEILPSLP
jgi:aminoglycoside phosphotransferase (APT) family kinase protein